MVWTGLFFCCSKRSIIFWKVSNNLYNDSDSNSRSTNALPAMILSSVAASPLWCLDRRISSSAAKSSTTSLNRLYSKRRCANSSLGSISLPCSSSSLRGMSILALMRIRVAATSINSLATSMLRVSNSLMYDKKSSVILAMGISLMSSSSLSMKNNNRSNGPSNRSVLMVYVCNPVYFKQTFHLRLPWQLQLHRLHFAGMPVQPVF